MPPPVPNQASQISSVPFPVMPENGHGGARDTGAASVRKVADDLLDKHKNDPVELCEALHKQSDDVRRLVISRGGGGTLRTYLGLEAPSRYGKTPHAHRNWPAPRPLDLAIAAVAVDARDEALCMLDKLESALKEESLESLEKKPEYRASVKEALLHLLGHLHQDQWLDKKKVMDGGGDRDRIMHIVLDYLDKPDPDVPDPDVLEIRSAIQEALSKNDAERKKPHPAPTPARRYADSIRQEWRAKSGVDILPTPFVRQPAGASLRHSAYSQPAVIKREDIASPATSRAGSTTEEDPELAEALRRSSEEPHTFAQEDMDLQRAMEESLKSAPPVNHMQSFLDRHAGKDGPLRVLPNEGDKATGTDVCLALLQFVTGEPRTEKLLQKATELQALYLPRDGNASGSTLFSASPDNPRFKKMVELINQQYGVKLDVRVLSVDDDDRFRISQLTIPRGIHPVLLVDDGVRHCGLLTSAPAPGEKNDQSAAATLRQRSNAAVQVFRDLRTQAAPATTGTPAAPVPSVPFVLPAAPTRPKVKRTTKILSKTRGQIYEEHCEALKEAIVKLKETPSDHRHYKLRLNKAKALERMVRQMEYRTKTHPSYRDSKLRIVQSAGTRPLSPIR